MPRPRPPSSTWRRSDFAIEDVTIVGTDLQMVERVTGRLTAGKLAGAGAASGAWFGLFVGLLMSFYGGSKAGFALILVAIAIGALFGAVMGYLGYSVAKGKRDFTSSSQVVARRYDVLCQPQNGRAGPQSPGPDGTGQAGLTNPCPRPVRPTASAFGAVPSTGRCTSR